MHRVLLSSTALAGLITAYGPNVAAQSRPSTESASSVNEIIVTAEKRSENINAVPMSITAVPAVVMQEKGIVTVADLARIEPSLQYTETVNGTPVYTIRGVGYYEQSLSASPTISTYQDEVAYPFPVMSRGALLDPERVEVLKGPQGTLYGQNATGGAINFIAAKPTNSLEAGVDYTYARFNDNLVSAFISGPLTSTLNARLSGSLEEGGAWQKSVTRDDSLGDKNVGVLRLLLDWRPTDKFEVNLNFNGWIDRSETQAGQLDGVRFSSPQYISPDALTPVTANFLPQPVYFATYPTGIKQLVDSPTGFTNDQAADWAAGTHPRKDETFYQASLRLDYQWSDALALTSITSFERFSEHDLQDQSGVGFADGDILLRGSVQSVLEELRFHGDFHNGAAHWLAGYNHETDDSIENDFVDPFVTSSAYLTGGSLFSLLPLTPFNYGAYSKVSADTNAGFANLDYGILDGVVLHGGVRYTEVDQNIASCSYGTAPVTAFFDGLSQQLAAAFGGPAPTPVAPLQCATLGPPPSFQPGLLQTAFNQHNISWHAGADWTPVPRTLLYISISKGFKAGSSPALGATYYTQFTPVQQESVMAYEAGFKSSLMDRTLQINGAYFHYDYDNKQFLGRVVDPTGIFGAVQTLVNVPRSAVDGVELTTVWQPVHGLSLNAAMTYLDTRVTSDFTNFATYITGPTDTIDLKGEAFPFTPTWSVQYGARYDWTLRSGLSAFVSADASYQSSTNSSFGAAHAATEGPPVANKAYSLLNLMAGLETADKRWRWELWGRNVTDTYYWNNVVWVNDSTVKFTGMPATFGITLHYRYD